MVRSESRPTETQLRFYTDHECDQWLTGRQRQKPDAAPGLHKLVVPYHDQPPSRIRYFALWIAGELPYRMETLLWVTQWGIWASSENWHLYYKLRQSYGDPRLLHEAPGHLFLDYESEDLATMLQVCMLNGWDAYLLTEADYVNAFFSHDGFIDFYAEREAELDGVNKALGSAGQT